MGCVVIKADKGNYLIYIDLIPPNTTQNDSEVMVHSTRVEDGFELVDMGVWTIIFEYTRQLKW